MKQTSILTGSDVAKLLKDPSAENRAEAARKVSQAFSAGGLSDAERLIVEDIFRAMLHDTEQVVRQSLSENLKSDPTIPRDVAQALARDVASVALPMVEFSTLLKDEDLIEIIRAQSPQHQMAVARRASISTTVTDVLADTHNEDVVAAMVANEGAVLSESAYAKVLDEFGTSAKVNGPMALRKNLPLKVAERLITFVSDQLRDHLMVKHGNSANALTDMVLQAREKTILNMLQDGAVTTDVIDLVDQLYRQKQLTPTIVMRSLLMGDVIFFEASLARMADVPVKNAYKLIHDNGDRGLMALFQKCGLSVKLLDVARAAIKIADGLQLNSSDDREHFQQLMIERVLTQFGEQIDTENLDYFVTKLVSDHHGHHQAA